VESLSLARPPCRKHASALFISPAGNAGAGAGILLHCAGEWASENSLLSQSPSSVFSLRARLRLRSPRSLPVLGFRSVLSAALTGCDLKGGGLARDLGRFAPLCVIQGEAIYEIRIVETMLLLPSQGLTFGELWLSMLGEKNLGCAVMSDVFELDAWVILICNGERIWQALLQFSLSFRMSTQPTFVQGICPLIIYATSFFFLKQIYATSWDARFHLFLCGSLPVWTIDLGITYIPILV
jgi:hypothetical protein